MDFSDQDLVREIRSGSSVAFERLMQRYVRLVQKIAFGFTGDAESAMDIVQDTFLKVHARLSGWRGDGDLKNWVARIAANQALNYSRSRRRHPTSELDPGEAVFLQPDPDADPEEELRAGETSRSLRRSLASLSPRQRLAVVLRYYQGMSTKQIAGVLACSDATARNILFRSLGKLRTTLAHSEETLR